MGASGVSNCTQSTEREKSPPLAAARPRFVCGCLTQPATASVRSKERAPGPPSSRGLPAIVALPPAMAEMMNSSIGSRG